MNVDAIRLYSTSLDAQNLPGGDSQYIELGLSSLDLTKDYIIKKIIGLEPPPISVWSGTRGVQTSFGAMEPRQIDILLELNPFGNSNKTVSELRDDLYKLINSPVNDLIDFRLMYNNVIVALAEGKIVRVDFDLFSSKTEIEITIVCEDALFKGVSSNLLDLRNADAPYDESYLFEDVASTAPHGFSLLAEVNELGGGTAVFFQMNTMWDGAVVSTFDVPWLFNALDRIYINSQFGELEINWLAWDEIEEEYTTVGLGHLISAQSIWPIIFPGHTLFTLPDYFRWDIVEWRHYPTYWGV